jgi:hypothetical protein
MSDSFWVWTHLAFILLIGRVWTAKALRFDLPPGGVASGLLIIGALSMLEFQDSDLAGWLLAWSGTLSVGTLMILALGILPGMEIPVPISRLERAIAHLFWLGLGIVLFPTALGWGSYDFYVLGYGQELGWVALLLSLLFWAVKQRLLAIYLVLSVLTWRLQLGESPNLWDYLLDPWIMIGSAFWLILQLFPKRPVVVSQEGPEQDQPGGDDLGQQVVEPEPGVERIHQ